MAASSVTEPGTYSNSPPSCVLARMVSREQAHVPALIQQPSRDRRADRAGPANDKDPLDPHGIPSRGPNRRSM
jgi:hypothetical protein